MYLCRCYRAKDGKRHAYWALVRSVRTARGPRQQVVAYLGELDEQGRLGIRQAAEEGHDPQHQLFPTTAARWVEVNLEAVRVENHQLESRMREIRSSGMAGGEAEINRPSLPRSTTRISDPEIRYSVKIPNTDLWKSGQITSGCGLAESVARQMAELEEDARYRDNLAKTKRRQIIKLTGLQERDLELRLIRFLEA
jgi:hypothetical protein